MRDVTTVDGRTLRVHEAGAPEGPVVLAQQGTPMTGLLFEAHVRDAEQRGIRLVSYDRPGYGGSPSGASRAGGPMPLRAPRCSLTASRRLPRSGPWRRSTPTGSIGSPGW